MELKELFEKLCNDLSVCKDGKIEENMIWTFINTIVSLRVNQDQLVNNINEINRELINQDIDEIVSLLKGKINIADIFYIILNAYQHKVYGEDELYKLIIFILDKQKIFDNNDQINSEKIIGKIRSLSVGNNLINDSDEDSDEILSIESCHLGYSIQFVSIIGEYNNLKTAKKFGGKILNAEVKRKKGAWDHWKNYYPGDGKPEWDELELDKGYSTLPSVIFYHINLRRISNHKVKIYLYMETGNAWSCINY